MNEFNDVFGDVQFPDAVIDPSGAQTTVEGEQTQGQAGDTPPAPGQESSTGTPTVENQQTSTTPDPKTNAGDVEGTDTKETQATEGAEKPLPFDQDPKWQKARAAEKTLNEFLESNNILSLDEVTERLNSSSETQSSEIQALTERLDELERFRTDRLEADRQASLENETEDDRMARIEAENTSLREQLEARDAQVQDQRENEAAVNQYTSEVDKVINAIDPEMDKVDRTMFRMLMGVQNPAMEVELTDTNGTRTATKSALTTFKGYLNHIRQEAINKYAAGKSEFTVTSRTSTGETSETTKPTKNYDPEKDSIDDVFESGNKEFLEVLTQGMKASH